MSTLPAREQLDINNIDDDGKLYEPLEVETGKVLVCSTCESELFEKISEHNFVILDAAEFYNVDSPASLVTESSETRKSYLHYIYSLGVIVLVLIIAIIFQYFSNKR